MPMNADHPVARFQSMFRHVTSETTLDLNTLYAEDVQFADPITSFKGRDRLSAYFARLQKTARHVEFDFGEPVVGDDTAALPWTMRIRAKGFPKTVVINGMSHLRFTDRIVYHRDYFDLGALTIEQIPLVGGLVRWLKRQA